MPQWCVMKLKLCVLLFIVAAAHPAASQPNTPALRITEMFFERCVAPLLAEGTIITDGLERLPHKTAVSLVPNSQGKVWMAKDAHVSLSAITDKTDTFDGCSTSWHSSAAVGRKIDKQYVIAAFDRWADQVIQNGDFIGVNECGERSTKFTRVLESTVERHLPVRVVVSTIDELDFVYLVAAEIPNSKPRQPCE